MLNSDFDFCQDFVSMEKEGGGTHEFRSLEVREASSLHLKISARNLLIYVGLHCVNRSL